MKTIRRSPTSLRLTGLLLAVAALAAVPAHAADSENSPWTLLETLRNSLQKSGPMTGRFTQTYIPAGFESGDRESGHLSMWLPDCLRWNYEEPQPKSFLVCQGEVYFWNEGEASGRHYKIDPHKETGLDLLLVPVAALRERYVASSRLERNGSYVISLTLPSVDDESFSAEIHLDAAGERVVGLEYTDTEGNLTRFRINSYAKLSHTALFSPPSDVRWTQE
jgi:outer membrane lipoprotein-sorting protein